jgi:hypothetical protein
MYILLSKSQDADLWRMETIFGGENACFDRKLSSRNDEKAK